MNVLVSNQFLHTIRDAIGLIGVAIICIGAIRAVYQLYKGFVDHAYDMNAVRLGFGDSIILGLEFMMGADIIASLVAPDYYNLGLLAIIVVIRTVLSYFLSRELEQRA
ncbi:MAG: DUF1622 domain-containing protein [Candidatus Babeliales bacterium]